MLRQNREPTAVQMNFRAAVFIFDPVYSDQKGCKEMSQPVCPECGGTVNVPADALQNELLPCPDCGTELEIISLNPLALERAPEIEEDWGE